MEQRRRIIHIWAWRLLKASIELIPMKICMNIAIRTSDTRAYHSSINCSFQNDHRVCKRRQVTIFQLRTKDAIGSLECQFLSSVFEVATPVSIFWRTKSTADPSGSDCSQSRWFFSKQAPSLRRRELPTHIVIDWVDRVSISHICFYMLGWYSGSLNGVQFGLVGSCD